jgi:hypothetical protein
MAARRLPPPARPRSRTKQRNKETRDPVTSPPLPVPDRIARGQLSPKSWPQLFWTVQTLNLLGFCDFKVPLSRGTTREPRKSRRGKSVEFDRDLFRVAKAGIVPLRVPKTRRARPASRGANNRCVTVRECKRAFRRCWGSGSSHRQARRTDSLSYSRPLCNSGPNSSRDLSVIICRLTRLAARPKSSCACPSHSMNAMARSG